MNNKKFLLPASNELEIERLVNQAMGWEEETGILLDRIGIQPGWNCGDVGCGPIGILRSLSLRVGEIGHVVGLDQNPAYVKTARTFIGDNHLKNIQVIQGDMYENNLEPRSFDLTHSRFIFTQVGCDCELLRKMINLTRPGGIVVSQESDWTTWNCYPMHPSWEKMRNALIKLFTFNGGDINAGRRTYKMFKEVGLDDIQIRTAILTLLVGNIFRSGMNQLARSMREKILDAKILNKSEFNQALEDCDAIRDDPDYIISSYTLFQVWGKVKEI
jgi:ubiquinone/menaquinone biosynthesis C-methylase UbiE